MQEENRKDSEGMTPAELEEFVKSLRKNEAHEIYLMLLEAKEQGKSLEEFSELLKARIKA